MSRVLHGMPINELPPTEQIDPNDQIVAYREDTGKAYRANVDDLAAQGIDLLDKVYPVGSIYMSVNNTSPAQLFGGTWTQIKDTFLLSAGDAHSGGETGGAETVTLSTSQIPSHTHTMPAHTHSIPSLSGTAASAGAHTHGGYYRDDNYLGGNGDRIGHINNYAGTLGTITTSAGAHTHSVTTNSSTTGSTSGTSGSTGSGSSHNNMPPYLTVYMWQRTA